MKYHRTQILLDPEEHRRLVREAAERGLSFAAYLREIVATRVAEEATPYDARSWDSLFGIISAGAPGADFDTEVAEAFEAEYRRDVGARSRAPKKTPGRARRRFS
ncbi:MAG: hypothetical protein HY775_02630 [Acidobacteria bacterium]|nr:hypothetical protein [Acidobacteriota bacterium]